MAGSPGRSAVRRELDELALAGPREVLRGDLALAGLPGVVFAPAGGLGLPAVAFGHGWLQPVGRYLWLLRHLASWGIVAAAPATEPGPLASPGGLASDLRTALDVCAGARLAAAGGSRISVDPDRLALAGHGMGGGAAVLAAAVGAAGTAPVAAVVTLAVAETWPSAIGAAGLVRVPALHLAGGRDKVAPPVGNAEPVAAAWGGPASLRTLAKASHLGFTENRHWSDLILDGRPEYGTHRVARSFLTAFLLRHLTGETAYDELLDSPLKGTELVTFG